VTLIFKNQALHSGYSLLRNHFSAQFYTNHAVVYRARPYAKRYRLALRLGVGSRLTMQLTAPLTWRVIGFILCRSSRWTFQQKAQQQHIEY